MDTILIGGDALINKEVVETLLETGRHNVIVVDWTDSNLNPYPQAVANGRVVGAQIAKMVKFLKRKTQLNPENVHIIGHSLGGHVAGWAGERIPKLGRITGLDPAGPYFRRSSKAVRLDNTDAQFVDVIHTNAAKIAIKGLGIEQPIGHVDFYPNGGDDQPGCENDQVNITTSKDGEIVEFGSTGCDHFRAVELFTASIKKCQFEAVKCTNYELFKSGKCKSGKKALMGNSCDKTTAGLTKGLRYFVDTTNKYPFC